jgi:hypothetical protein
MTGFRRSENTTKPRTLYEEVWECYLPKRQTLEEDLLSLQALAPDMVEDLHSLFKEAVIDSLANTLGRNEARALMRLMARTDFENPREVFEALDSIFYGDSQILRDAIIEEFRVSVHLLLKKTERRIARFVDPTKSYSLIWKLDPPIK